MKKNILLVEDESLMREIVLDYFKKEQWAVFEADNGKSALEMFNAHRMDLVILDVMVPEVDGWTVCKRIRRSSDVPIIFLTARSEDDDKLMGFEFGADDYVTKPFSPKVLVARSKMLMKRAEGTIGKEDAVLSYGDLQIHVQAHQILISGHEVELAPKEYELLVYLVKNRDFVLSREHILNQVWGYDFVGDVRTVDSHIKKLRKKLGTIGNYIHTIRQAGYKFKEEK
ncbi:response regulator transcription factor [Brevibacillus sp. SYSU BS000544]|uniref:response regulator transcription factor n=1 Tax=Brevibacillus sp. SYSU BS000544 TaxID=3416443 RepID=UPI003CE50D54